MKNSRFACYLQDHLAGSAAAITLMGTLEQRNSGYAVSNFLHLLRKEIESERKQLEMVAAKFPLVGGTPRKVVAWVGEKSLELKLSFDGSGDRKFQLFEGLEAISLGIAGKRLLWRVLWREAEQNPLLAGVGLNYPRLTERAVAQRKELEPYRLNAAAGFLSDDRQTAQSAAESPKSKRVFIPKRVSDALRDPGVLGYFGLATASSLTR